MRPHDDRTQGLLRIRTWSEEISKVLEISEGTLYPILRRLTEEKYFETYLQESSEGPPRKYYRITKLGKEFQKDQFKQWMEFNKQIETIIGREII